MIRNVILFLMLLCLVDLVEEAKGLNEAARLIAGEYVAVAP